MKFRQKFANKKPFLLAQIVTYAIFTYNVKFYRLLGSGISINPVLKTVDYLNIEQMFSRKTLFSKDWQ